MNRRQIRFFFSVISLFLIIYGIVSSNLANNKQSISPENIPFIDEVKSAYPDPLNMTNLWSNSVNNTPFYSPQIEYDLIQDMVYVGYYISNNSENHFNITKYDSNREIIWQITSFGMIFQSNNLIDMILTKNGTTLFVLISIGFINAPTNHFLLVYNTTTGNQHYNISFQTLGDIFITQMKIDRSEKNIYFMSSYSTYPPHYSQILKINLENQQIFAFNLYGNGINSYYFKDFTISTNDQYLYVIGNIDPDSNSDTKPCYTFLLQYNSSGHLFGEYLNSTLTNYQPLKISFSPDSDYLISLMQIDDKLSLINLELNGTWINQVVISSFNEQIRINKIQLDFSTNSLLIAGYLKKFTENTRGYLAQINISGQLIWENLTYYSLTQIQLYSDFIISKEFGYIELIGIRIQNDAIQFTGVQYYKYDLKNAPLSPTLYSTDKPSYDGKIQLNWTAPLRAQNYTILRSTESFESSANAEAIASGITSLNYEDAVPINGTYYYRIFASGDYGNSTLSNEIEMLESPPYTSYLFPLQVEKNKLNNTVLNWTKPSGDILWYHIFRSDNLTFNPSTTPVLVKIDDIYQSYIDENLSLGTWYYGIIVEYYENAMGHNSSISNIQSITIFPPIQNFSLNFQGSNPFVNNVSLEWDSVPETTQYRIFRQLGEYNDTQYFAPINSTLDTEYFDDPPNEFRHYWLIEAYNGPTLIGRSNIITDFIYEQLNSPVLPEITENVTNNIISFSWDAVPKAEFYFILRSTSMITSFSSDLIIANNSFINRTYIESITYIGNFYFVVVAGRMGLNSSISNCINFSVQHLPKPVIGVSIMNGRVDGIWDEGKTRWKITQRFVQINWTESNNVWYYQILRYHEPITTININSAIILIETSQIGFNDFSIINGLDYYYIIRAVNGTGLGELNSSQNQLGIIRFTPDPVLLQADISLNYSVTLNWSQGNYSTLGYQIMRYHLPMNETNWAVLVDYPETVNFSDYVLAQNYIEYNILPGIWYYIVVARNSHGASNFSNCITIEIKSVPHRPILNQVFSPNYDHSVNLTWQSTVMTNNYTIYRSTSPITEANLNEVLKINTTSQTWYFDANLQPNIYYYVIRGQNETGFSAISNMITVQMIHLPNAPTWIQTLTPNFINRINLTWTDQDLYGNYSIYRSFSNIWNQSTAEKIIQNYNKNNIIINCSDELTYYYWIFAFNGSGQSIAASPIQLTAYIMNKPIIKMVSKNPTTNHTVILSWQNISHATSYEVHRSSESGFNPSIATYYKTILGNFSYNESNIPLGKYYYVVIPVSDYGYGDPSDYIEVRVEDSPPAPLLVQVIPTNLMDFIVIWNQTNEAEYYMVYYSKNPITNESSFFDLTASPPLNNNTYNYTFKELGIGTFYFVVVAVNGTGQSEYSNMISSSNYKEPGLPSGIKFLIIAFSSFGGILGTFILVKFIQNRKNDPERLLKRHGLDL